MKTTIIEIFEKISTNPGNPISHYGEGMHVKITRLIESGLVTTLPNGNKRECFLTQKGRAFYERGCPQRENGHLILPW